MNHEKQEHSALQQALLKTFGKIETASAIFWDYLGMFREHGQKNIFLGIKLFC